MDDCLSSFSNADCKSVERAQEELNYATVNEEAEVMESDGFHLAMNASFQVLMRLLLIRVEKELNYATVKEEAEAKLSDHDPLSGRVDEGESITVKEEVSDDGSEENGNNLVAGEYDGDDIEVAVEVEVESQNHGAGEETLLKLD